MARELNHELFGEGDGRPESRARLTHAQETSVDVARGEDVRRLTLGVEATARKFKEFEARMETMQAKLEESARQNKQRFERVQGHFQNQNEAVKNGFGDLHQKIAQVASRANERKISEGVIRDMVDRHAQAVQSFEVRLTQLQRLISEQELQLINARSELKNAMIEMARLKKI